MKEKRRQFDRAFKLSAVKLLEVSDKPLELAHEDVRQPRIGFQPAGHGIKGQTGGSVDKVPAVYGRRPRLPVKGADREVCRPLN